MRAARLAGVGGATLLLAANAAAPAPLAPTATAAAVPPPGFGRNVQADLGLGSAGAGDNEAAVTVDQAGTAWVAWQQKLGAPSYVTSTTDGVNFTMPTSPDSQSLDGDVAWATTTAPVADRDTPVGGAGESGLFWGVLSEAARAGLCGAPSINVSTSGDQGATWNSGYAVCQPFGVDRDWLAAYTPPQHRGMADAVANTWVYTEHHDLGVSNIWFSSSPNGGMSWNGSPVGSVPGAPVSAEQAGSTAQLTSLCNTIPGGIAVDQRGAHAGRVYAVWETSDVTYNVDGCNYTQTEPFDHIFISYSDDNGATWTSRAVFNDVCAPSPPSPPAFSPNPNPGGATTVTGCQDVSELFTSIAVDDAGNVYVAFVSRGQLAGSGPPEYDVYVSVSRDGGDHWNGSSSDSPGPPYKVNSDVGTHYEPWVAAGGDGGVDVVYYRTAEVAGVSPVQNKPARTSNSAVWGVYMSQSFDHGQSFQETRVDDAGPNGIYFGDVCSIGIACSATPVPGTNWANDRTLYDVFGVAVGPDGAARVAWTDLRTAMGPGCLPGSDPTCEGPPNPNDTKAQVFFACQTRGLGLRGQVLTGVCPHAAAAAAVSSASPTVAATVSPGRLATPTPSPRPLPNTGGAGGSLAGGLLLGLVTLLLGGVATRRRPRSFFGSGGR